MVKTFIEIWEEWKQIPFSEKLRMGLVGFGFTRIKEIVDSEKKKEE